MKRISFLICIVFFSVMATGCGVFAPGQSPDEAYKKAKQGTKLKLPAELSQPNVN